MRDIKLRKIAVRGFMVRFPSRHGPMLAWNLGLALTESDARDRFRRKRLKKGVTWKQAYLSGARVVPVRLTTI